MLLDGVVEIVERNRGEQEKAEKDLWAYVAKHRLEVRSLRAEGKDAIAELEPAARKAFEERTKKERLERETRIRNAAASFDRPKDVLNIARLVD